MNSKKIKLVLTLGAVVTSLLIISKAEAPRGIFTPVKEETSFYQPKFLPEKELIEVPYTVQAPFANWTVHEQSCEEAAILMYHYYLEGDKRTDLDQKQVESELVAMKNWQGKNWGAERDLDLESLGELAKEYYGHNYQVINNIDEKVIKNQIAAGKPVLVPVMTHSLENSHYGRQDSYHILLIKGYDQTGVVTNDAGIKEGKNWHYNWEILWKAIDAQKVNSGRKLLILTK